MVPLIDGSTVFSGGPTVGDCETTSVGFAVAVAEPALFDAVTWTRSVDPTSALVSVRVEVVAPAMVGQF
jgi:hypothetical protein